MGKLIKNWSPEERMGKIVTFMMKYPIDHIFEINGTTLTMEQMLYEYYKMNRFDLTQEQWTHIWELYKDMKLKVQLETHTIH